MLTAEQEVLRDRIMNAQVQLEAAQATYMSCRAQCVDHVYENRVDVAVCAICGKHGGWWCPGSPDHTCEHDHNGVCRYCGAPEDRS